MDYIQNKKSRYFKKSAVDGKFIFRLRFVDDDGGYSDWTEDSDQDDKPASGQAKTRGHSHKGKASRKPAQDSTRARRNYDDNGSFDDESPAQKKPGLL